MEKRPAASPPDSPPGQTLGATLGLIALFFLPLLGGGYSGPGYQVGLVLLPIAAAIVWATAGQRPRTAVIVLALLGLSAALLPLWIHPGRLLWHYALHIPAAWAVTWVLFSEVPDKAKYFLPAAVTGAVLSAIYGWWGVLSSGTLSQQNLGTFGLHNAYAGYLLLAWPVAALAAGLTERLWQRVAYTAAALLLVVTLLFTYSRAAWLVFVLQLLGIGAWALGRRARHWNGTERLMAWSTGMLALITVLLFAVPSMRHVLGSIGNLADYSLQGRLRFWQAAQQMFAGHPLTGVGLGGFAYSYPQYQLDWRYYSVDPHSWPLQLLCELGLLGCFVLLLVLLGMWWWLRRLWRGPGGPLVALLLSTAVVGSLVHAAVDFDYTFGATTALIGALLAYGAFAAQPRPDAAGEAGAKHPLWERIAVALTAAALVFAAVLGQSLTLERYTLDRLRDSPGLTTDVQQSLLQQALRFVPYDFRTRYKLASLLATPGKKQNLPQAKSELAACLKLNQHYTLAWALQGRLAGAGAGDADLERALKLDPYNYPEHYFLWASLAQSDAARRERLLLGLKRIPIDDPITPQHIRPTWYQLNPMMVAWYEELARLAQTPEEDQLYSRRAETFKQYWKNEQAKQAAAQETAPVPKAPESSA